MPNEDTNVAEKRFMLKLPSNSEIEMFKRFRNTAIYKGSDPGRELLKLISEYNYTNLPRNIVLVSETELLRLAKAEGLKTNKALIVKYRREGKLNLANQKLFWTNPAGKVVYDKENTLQFLRERSRDYRIREKASI